MPQLCGRHGPPLMLIVPSDYLIPLGAVHRLVNPGKLPMRLVEVQTGGYFGEDDIIRYDDKYARD